MTEEERRWLTLSAASKLLGIHPATLRQWADAGQVPSYRTPGGHRRFDAADIRAFLMQASTDAPRSEGATTAAELVETALAQTRNELKRSPLDENAWYSALDEAGFERRRVLGRQQYEYAFRFVTRPQERQALKAKGRELGKAYAASSLKYSISLLETVRAFQYFRSNLLHTLESEDIETRVDDPDELRQQVDIFLNQVLYGMIDAYEHRLLDAEIHADTSI
ncbi:MAG: helix-turn-helix domain-containing protein [Chloroflexi bacterium]|nr:helix-turn-helix domain-containing protein [Chloroflexota bacterium]